MDGTTDAIGTSHYTVREVVGVFRNEGALEAAVEQLELAGVNRAAISVLSVDNAQSDQGGQPHRTTEMTEDDPLARRAAYGSRGSLIEGEAVAVAVPLEIGGFAGAWAAAAAGGALATSIGATILGGGIGAGLGVLLFGAIAHHHAARIETELASGGLVLWVCTPSVAAEESALEVLRRCGGTSVHTHTLARQWGVADRPLHDVQPDPFLEHEKT
jgi:hypothetical protein